MVTEERGRRREVEIAYNLTSHFFDYSLYRNMVILMKSRTLAVMPIDQKQYFCIARETLSFFLSFYLCRISILCPECCTNLQVSFLNKHFNHHRISSTQQNQSRTHLKIRTLLFSCSHQRVNIRRNGYVLGLNMNLCWTFTMWFCPGVCSARTELFSSEPANQGIYNQSS